MTKKRKQYNAQFKAKVALEAAKEAKTTSQLSSQYDIHPTVINNWKRQLLEEASSLFEADNKNDKKSKDQQAQIDELYRQIGKLTVERDFLETRSEQLGLRIEKPW
jgi:transposase-like protein